MSLNRARLNTVLIGNTFLRGSMAASGGNALVGFYLASLAVAGQPIDATVVGNLNATLDACALLVAIPLGALIDRTSPRLMLVIGALIGAVATQLFGVTGVIAIFFLSRGLEGIAASATTPAILSYLTDATQKVPELRGRVMSWFEISLFAGLALGNLISGSLWERFNTGGFAILALGYVTAALLFNWGAARTPTSAPRHLPTRDVLRGLREAVGDPLLRRLALPWLLFNAVVGLWLSQLAFQLNGPPRTGQWLVGLLTPTQVALYLFGYTLVFTVGVYIGGVSTGRWTRVALMRSAFIAMFGVTVFVFLLNQSADWSAGQRLVVLAGYAIFAGAQGTFPPAALAYLADVAGKSQGRGSAMGIYTLLLSMGNVVGSLLGGVLGDWFAMNGLLLGTLVLATLGLLSLLQLPAATVGLAGHSIRPGQSKASDLDLNYNGTGQEFMTEPVEPATIVMYSTRWCPDCHRARHVFAATGVGYVDIDIDRHPDAAAVVLAVNNGRRSVPTIVFPDGSTLTEPSNRTLEQKLTALMAAD